MASAFQANAFQAAPAFQIEAVTPPVVDGPRGAWISDEKVERARRKRWREQVVREEVLRLDLEDILAGRLPRSQIEILPPEVPGLNAFLIQAPALSPGLLELRNEVEGLNAWAEAEAEMDEEAGIVSLLMGM